MTMGCGSSKKIVNESPSDRKVKTTLLPEGSSSREVHSSGNKRNAKRKVAEKTAKFRARFDTRVTEKYSIKALIGKGSFSKVVRVEDRISKQPYAIKMIAIEEGKDVFESELAVMRRVQHPYVVSLYEVFECKDKVYLVMELATGGELLDRILSRGYFTERDATHVLCMVLEGVRYLHSLGITHRDLKPENLLYYHPGNDSKIMITDFGLSNLKKNPNDSTMETTCGTPEYIAPEILMSRPYTNSVDVWSIGVISYILLSGAMPFDDDNRTRLYRAILTAKYNYSGEPWNDVSELAKSFISKLLVLEPERRMTAEEALKHPWITSFAASSSFKNLHGSISSNWLKSSSRLNSAKSNRSKRSNRSSRSGKSVHSKHRSSKAASDNHERSSITSTGGAISLPDSSKLRTTTHLKLTQQLVEKLQAVAKEETIGSNVSIDTGNSSQTSAQTCKHSIENSAYAIDRSNVSGTQHLKIPSPSNESNMRLCDIAGRNIVDVQKFELYPPLEQPFTGNSSNNNIGKSSIQYPPRLQLPKLTERDEDFIKNQANSKDHSAFFTSRDTLPRVNCFEEVAMLPKPIGMDIDYYADDRTASFRSSSSPVIVNSPSTSMPISPTRLTRLRSRMSPNANRNKVASSF